MPWNLSFPLNQAINVPNTRRATSAHHRIQGWFRSHQERSASSRTRISPVLELKTSIAWTKGTRLCNILYTRPCSVRPIVTGGRDIRNRKFGCRETRGRFPGVEGVLQKPMIAPTPTRCNTHAQPHTHTRSRTHTCALTHKTPEGYQTKRATKVIGRETLHLLPEKHLFDQE